jgi:ABC-type Fe3+ transport system substrate-binding protein
MVREMVERGELAMGLMDSDDAWAALDRARPVAMVVPEPTLVIPNVAALVAGAPHPVEGRLLIDFLVSGEVEALLARKPMRQAPLRASVNVPEGVDWGVLGARVEQAAEAFYETVRP